MNAATPRLLFLSLLVTAVGCAWGAEPTASISPRPASLAADGSMKGPVAKGQAIFAAHHSYYQPVPPVLTEIAAAGGYPDQVTVGDSMIGGSKTLRHWELPDDKNTVKQALEGGQVDVLVLTPVYLPDDGIEKFAQLGLEHNPNLRVTVMELWLPFDIYNPTGYDRNYRPVAGEPPPMPKPAQVDHNAATGEALRKMHEYYFQTMDAKVSALNKQFGRSVISVVPMGQAVIALREKVIAGQAPGIATQEELFKDQLGHPTPPMVALEAYCHYAVIYRKSPVGLPVPKVLSHSKIPKDQQEPLNKLLQQIAWDAVTHHPLSGVSAS